MRESWGDVGAVGPRAQGPGSRLCKDPEVGV